MWREEWQVHGDAILCRIINDRSRSVMIHGK